MATRKKGLGRGLDALLGTDSDALDVVGKRAAKDAPSQLPISALRAGRYQPRTHMDESALNELADSIRTQGVMQPILVRPLSGGGAGQYEIIAGERRFRAAQLAGLDHIPVLVREVADENAAVMALIENIQREDLNPLEEAQGVRRLLDEFGLTHEQAATAIGRSRSATTNLLRLLNLAEPVQTMLLAGDIDMGHARALLATDAAQQILLANEVIARRLSVRETEKRVARALREQDEALAAPTRRADPSSARNGDLLRLEKALSDHLATKVRIKTGARRGGQLVIDFTDWSHLDSLLERQGLGAVLSGE
ncbi:ParB family chromosome partitioning protein OS=Castellaniella defragrans OX=75697 GN=HNR28_003584 PE=3 SV=1 [Castellaniella defragrans]